MKWLKENHPESVTDQAVCSHNCSDSAGQSNSSDLLCDHTGDGQSTVPPEIKAEIFQ